MLTLQWLNVDGQVKICGQLPGSQNPKFSGNKVILRKRL